LIFDIKWVFTITGDAKLRAMKRAVRLRCFQEAGSATDDVAHQGNAGTGATPVCTPAFRHAPSSPGLQPIG